MYCISAYLIKQSGTVEDHDPAHNKNKKIKRKDITELYRQYGSNAYKHMGITGLSGGRFEMAREDKQWYYSGTTEMYMESRCDFWAWPRATYDMADGEKSIINVASNRVWGMVTDKVMYFSMLSGTQVPCNAIEFKQGNGGTVSASFNYNGKGIQRDYRTGTVTEFERNGYDLVSAIATSSGSVRASTDPICDRIVYPASVFFQIPIFSSVEDYLRYEAAVNEYLSSPTEENLGNIDLSLEYSLNP